MKIVWLSRYVTVLFAVLLFGTLATTYAPGAGFFAATIQSIAAIGLVLGVVVSLSISRLSADHWVHRSKTISTSFIVAAVMTTIITLAFVG